MQTNACTTRRETVQTLTAIATTPTVLSHRSTNERTNTFGTKYIEPDGDTFHHGYYLADAPTPITDQHGTVPLTVHAGFVLQDVTPGERKYDLEDVKTKAELLVNNGTELTIGTQLQTPTLVPAIETPAIDEFNGYLPALSRNAITTPDKQFTRLDRQLKYMIRDAKDRLNAHAEVNTVNNVILTGYSAPGVFANRFTLLHPTIVDYLISGGYAIHTIPADSWSGTPLLYGVGTKGLEASTGESVNIDEYKQTPKFMFMKSMDGINPLTNKVVFESKTLSILREIYTETSTLQQWKKTQYLHDELNQNVTFRTYEYGDHRPPPNILPDVTPELTKKNILTPKSKRVHQHTTQENTPTTNRTNRTNTTNRAAKSKNKSIINRLIDIFMV